MVVLISPCYILNYAQERKESPMKVMANRTLVVPFAMFLELETEVQFLTDDE